MENETTSSISQKYQTFRMLAEILRRIEGLAFFWKCWSVFVLWNNVTNGSGFTDDYRCWDFWGIIFKKIRISIIFLDPAHFQMTRLNCHFIFRFFDRFVAAIFMFLEQIKCTSLYSNRAWGTFSNISHISNTWAWRMSKDWSVSPSFYHVCLSTAFTLLYQRFYLI